MRIQGPENHSKDIMAPRLARRGLIISVAANSQQWRCSVVIRFFGKDTVVVIKEEGSVQSSSKLTVVPHPEHMHTQGNHIYTSGSIGTNAAVIKDTDARPFAFILACAHRGTTSTRQAPSGPMPQ